MKILKIQDHTHEIRELFLERSDFNFRAGQFLMLHVPQESGKPALRAYSIASGESETQVLRLIFKAVETGIATKYVWELKAGEEIAYTGPFGKLFFTEPPAGKVFFLNTGSGISQHLCYLQTHAEKHPNTEYRLFFGVRTAKDIYLEEDLKDLKNRLPHFYYHFVLSREGKTDETRLSGYVQNALKYYLDESAAGHHYYMCGNGEMIKGTKLMLEEYKVSPTHIKAEAFD